MLKIKNSPRLYGKLALLLFPVLFYSCAIGIKTQQPIQGPERFRQEIAAFRQCDEKTSYPDNAILFVGSSSIKRWKTATSFPNLKVINRGFGGSQISELIYYYDQVVLKYKPSKIVFYAGDNDIAVGKSADQVLKDYQHFVAKVEQDLPGVPLFYLPIKPSVSRWQFWSEMSTANEMIKQFCNTKTHLFYVETSSAMLTKNLEPNPDLLVDDGLHMNERGYQLWNEILLPLIEKKQ